MPRNPLLRRDYLGKSPVIFACQTDLRRRYGSAGRFCSEFSLTVGRWRDGSRSTGWMKTLRYAPGGDRNLERAAGDKAAQKEAHGWRIKGGVFVHLRRLLEGARATVRCAFAGANCTDRRALCGGGSASGCGRESVRFLVERTRLRTD